MSQKIKFCPNCGSTHVEPDTSNRAEVYFSGGDPNKWMCNDCDYKGLMPEGDPDEDFNGEFSEEAEFQPEEEYSRIDTGFGIGYLKFALYVVVPATVIYLAYLYL